MNREGNLHNEDRYVLGCAKEREIYFISPRIHKGNVAWIVAGDFQR